MFRLLSPTICVLLVAISGRCSGSVLGNFERTIRDTSNIIDSGIGSATSSWRRILQQLDDNGNECSGICSHIPGSEMKRNVIPQQHDGTPFPKEKKSMNWTCDQWESHTISMTSSDSVDCLVLRDGLTRQCCTNLSSSYKCETMVEDDILSESSSYKSGRIPITQGDALNVSVTVDVTNMEISNHGVNGGAINMFGSIMLNWVDERLKWNYTDASSENRCATTSIRIDSGKIWVPDLLYPKFNYENNGEMKYVESLSQATVLADGRVVWIRRYHISAQCNTTLNGAGKHCSFMFQDHELEGSRVNYIINDIDHIDDTPSSNGIVIHNTDVLSEYIIDTNQSYLSMKSEYGSSIASTIHDVVINFFLVPRENECSICGHGGATLVNDSKIHIWKTTEDTFKEEFPSYFEKNVSTSQCYTLNKLLGEKSMSDKICLTSQANLEEFCCDDRQSHYDCENNVHDIILSELGDNTVTPPDPLSEDFGDNITNDFVKVNVALDVHHISAINVKENSIELLLSLELSWYDKRLAWEPFIGGCHRASFRASLDAELTEIWVPNIELVNKLTGLDALPEAHASVRYKGLVKWRRTGVVKASCDLTGVKHFPYDKTGCYIEFGGTRNPMYHRVHYAHVSKRDVEYSERLTDEDWSYQEYKIMPDRTQISIRIETLSGFENEVVRYQFFFDRASAYYTKMFVILYILFTYLSFGMFFVDYSLGERLGYGSSILFVIVATDITMSETTPVTNEFLWIYKLSFASKMYVITGLIQSIFVLWLYTRHDFGEDDSGKVESEEIQSFIHSSGDEGDASDDSLESNLPESMEQPSTALQIERRGTGRIGQMVKTPLAYIGTMIGHDHSNDGSQRVRLIKHLRSCDLIMFGLFFATYSIVLISLYLTLPR